jgi:ketosteroid isomerase-like protein
LPLLPLLPFAARHAAGGLEVALHAAMYLQVRDGHITRIEEYPDSAQRSSIRAAREALSR